MLVKAWECWHCGMLTKAEDEKDLPEGWLRIFWHKGGTHMEVNNVVCSGRCASRSFLAADEGALKPVRKRPQKAAQKPLVDNGKHVCPECGKAYDMPQHLGMHRKREHGVQSERDRQARVG